MPSRLSEIEFDFKLLSFFIAHTADSQARVQFEQRCSQALEVDSLSAHHTVRVFGLSFRPVRSGGDPANQEILDSVTIEYFNQS
jgi:hypothetical protein